MHSPESCRCQSCNGYLLFNIKLQKLQCTHCSREQSVEDYLPSDSVNLQAASRIQKTVDDENHQYKTVVPVSQDLAELNNVYVCSSCGGIITPGILSATTVCPFCTKPIVLSDKIRLNGDPDVLIPFKVDSKYFNQIFMIKLRQQMFLEDDFIANAPKGAPRACYYPFWLYDVKSNKSALFQVEHQIPSNKEVVHEVFKCVCKTKLEFSNIPQDACLELADELSQNIEPYDLQSTVPYHSAYLSGLNASIADINSKAAFSEIRRRVNHSLDNKLNEGLENYRSKIIDEKFEINPVKVKYAILPLWELNVPWEGGTAFFAMNGQSGKFVGNFPLDKEKVVLCIVTLSLLPFILLEILLSILLFFIRWEQVFFFSAFFFMLTSFVLCPAMVKSSAVGFFENKSRGLVAFTALASVALLMPILCIYFGIIKLFFFMCCAYIPGVALGYISLNRRIKEKRTDTVSDTHADRYVNKEGQELKRSALEPVCHYKSESSRIKDMVQKDPNWLEAVKKL